MMRPVRRASLFAAALVSVLLCATAGYPADRFVPGIEDLPLMPGPTASSLVLRICP